jgi:hypothetical protein
MPPKEVKKTLICKLSDNIDLLVVIRLMCSMHVSELGETSIYVADTAAENRRIKHPSTNNAYVLQYSDTRAR